MILAQVVSILGDVIDYSYSHNCVFNVTIFVGSSSESPHNNIGTCLDISRSLANFYVTAVTLELKLLFQ